MFETEAKIIRNAIPEWTFNNILQDRPCFIAGGALRSVFERSKINDIDIFFFSDSDFMIADSYLKIASDNPGANPHGGPYGRAVFTDSAVTFFECGRRIQLVRKITGHPHDVISEFDFTVCMAAASFRPKSLTDWFFINGDATQFLTDIAARRLVFNQTPAKYPIASLYRMMKYLRNGYRIGISDLIKLALAIQNIDIFNVDDLRDQLQGIDTLLMSDLMKQLTENDPHASYQMQEFTKTMEDFLRARERVDDMINIFARAKMPDDDALPF